MAESSTLRTGRAAARGVNRRTRRASSTCRPRMRSTTRRALNGVTRMNRACAFTSIGLPHSCRPLLRAVDAERPGRRELAELVADHRLRDVHGHVLAPVVDGDRVADHVGDDRRAPRPGADHPLVAPAVQLVELLERVVDRVHGHPAGGRALALPADAAGLAPADQLLLGVADLADGGAAGGLHLADLARRHPQGRQRALLGEQLDARPGGAAELGAAARPQLHVVDDGADRDVLEGQGVAGLDVGALAGLHRVAHPQAGGRDDVALLAVGVVEQRDVGGAVGVVLDRGHAGGHAVLVAAEVDDPVALLVAPTLVAGGDAAVDVAAALARAGREQRLLRGRLGDLGEVGHRAAPPSRRGWLVLADAHGYLASKISILSSGCRVTRARLVALRTPTMTPEARLVRLRLPLRCSMFTLVTRTEKMDCTASLISVLLASGWT